MSVHLKPVGAESIVVEGRIYPDMDDAKSAYRAKVRYSATFAALICPRTQTATVEMLHGDMRMRDAIDIGEVIYSDYGIKRIRWERSSGKALTKYRAGPRRWIDDKIGQDDA